MLKLAFCCHIGLLNNGKSGGKYVKTTIKTPTATMPTKARLHHFEQGFPLLKRAYSVAYPPIADNINMAMLSQSGDVPNAPL